MRVAWVIVALSMGVWVAPGAGQSGLDRAAGELARAWGAGDSEAVAAAMATGGVGLHLGGEAHTLLSVRQARAALGEFLEARAAGELRTVRVVELGGTPPEGFAELRWETVVRGTSQPVVHTVFVGYTQLGGGWWISEIRVL